MSNPFFETDAELLDDVRERLAALRGLPRFLGPRWRRQFSDLCQLVGLRIDPTDDHYWLILRPGHSRPHARQPEERVPPTAVQPDRYTEVIRQRSGGERWHEFHCRECGEALTGEEPGARQDWGSGRIFVTDRFEHDRWHASAAGAAILLRDARFRETVLTLFDGS